MKTKEKIVYVVDDDMGIREAISELLDSHGIASQSFRSAGEYMEATKPDLPGCLILDVELPDRNGLEFQKQIAEEDHPPIVFITGHGDIPSSVRAMKLGAVDFLTKPFSDLALITSVEHAIAKDREARNARSERAALLERYEKLTPRERDVLPLVVGGLLNKQAAAQLGISEVTLQVHRRNVLQKMGAPSVADLVRTAEKLRIPLTHSRKPGDKQ
ncbi:response regulator [Roseovarius mucosus]|uniref:response regulator transcription factor n=1 Tax=Roseovarius mucosus TaxID=215743 RepID=UPI001C60420E|nr:response regulator [Roseovarius mucosus]MBW4976204.1 response regulator [Roseovarius mucosus]